VGGESECPTESPEYYSNGWSFNYFVEILVRKGCLRAKFGNLEYKKKNVETVLIKTIFYCKFHNNYDIQVINTRKLVISFFLFFSIKFGLKLLYEIKISRKMFDWRKNLFKEKDILFFTLSETGEITTAEGMDGGVGWDEGRLPGLEAGINRGHPC
jgi:hypothetical protein